MRRFAIIMFVVYIVAIIVASATAKGALGKHDRDVIRFFQHHPKLAATPQGGLALSKVLPKVVREIDSAAPPLYPPHHALWVCIHGYEGAWDNHGPSYYGGLQMSWNWMKLIPGDAGNLTESQQEWAAEKAWQENGYSYSFLYQQWYEWDNADGCGTTG